MPLGLELEFKYEVGLLEFKTWIVFLCDLDQNWNWKINNNEFLSCLDWLVSGDLVVECPSKVTDMDD